MICHSLPLPSLPESLTLSGNTWQLDGSSYALELSIDFGTVHPHQFSQNPTFTSVALMKMLALLVK